MKRFTALLLTALLARSLTACGAAEAPSGSGADSVASTYASSAAPSAAQKAPRPAVTLSKATQVWSYGANDAVLVNSEWDSATVTVPGNETAQKAIQADLDQILSTFRATSDEYFKDATDFYDENGRKLDSPAYYHSLSITRGRCDNQVISLTFDEGNYTGNDNRYARNYDSATGQVLTLKDLGNGVDQVACDKIIRFVNQIHKKDGLFLDRIKTADLKDVVTDDMFYFSKNGLVFISGQYLLQSYAEGIVEFTISYSDLEGRLKDAYNLGGGATQCQTTLGAYALKPDGSLDTSKVNYNVLAHNSPASTDS